MRVLVLVAVCVVGCEDGPRAAALPIDIAIQDASPWHVHAPGKPFVILVRTSDPGIPVTIQAQWVDAAGNALGERLALKPGRATSVTAPAGDVGYYGLFFWCRDRRVAFPPQPAGFPSNEFGFAVLPPPPAEARPDPDSPFGTIHSAVTANGQWDPHLRGHHCKTLTWTARSPRSWGAAIRTIQRAGLTELPMIYKDVWRSDDHAAIGAEQVRAIADRFRSYARDDVAAWELGREENRRGRYKTPHYFANLRAKTRAIRAVSPDRRLVYNFEGFHYDDFERLAASDALGEFDVLSLHPYRWKRFETPESWLPEHLRRVRELLARHGRGDMELWFTEIGIPVRGTRDPNGFYGYPESGKQVPGASRDYAARYTVKVHAVALAEGVRRIYHYNYQNRGNDITYAEHHFGLRSYTGSSRTPGHPLPAYVAYVTMLRQLEGKRFTRARAPRDGVRVYEFGDTLLAWADRAVDVPWKDLTAAAPKSVRGMYGEERPVRDAGLSLDGRPCWITVR